MAYNRTTWVDYVTALSAANMNNIEEGLVNLDGTAMRAHNLGSFDNPATMFALVVEAAYQYLSSNPTNYNYMLYFRHQGQIGFMMRDNNAYTFKFYFGKFVGTVVRGSSTSYSFDMWNTFISHMGPYSGSAYNVDNGIESLRNAYNNLRTHGILKYCDIYNFDLSYEYKADGSGGPNTLHIISGDATGDHLSGYITVGTPVTNGYTFEKTKGLKFFEYDSTYGFYNVSEASTFTLTLSGGKLIPAQRKQLDEIYRANCRCIVFYSGRAWLYDRGESEAIDEDEDEGSAFFWQIQSASQYSTFILTENALMSRATRMLINLLTGTISIGEATSERQIMAPIRAIVYGGETFEQLCALASVQSVINVVGAQYAQVVWYASDNSGSYSTSLTLSDLVSKRLPLRIQDFVCACVDVRTEGSVTYYDYSTSFIRDDNVVHAIFSIYDIDDSQHRCSIAYKELEGGSTPTEGPEVTTPLYRHTITLRTEYGGTNCYLTFTVVDAFNVAYTKESFAARYQGVIFQATGNVMSTTGMRTGLMRFAVGTVNDNWSGVNSGNDSITFYPQNFDVSYVEVMRVKTSEAIEVINLGNVGSVPATGVLSESDLNAAREAPQNLCFNAVVGGVSFTFTYKKFAADTAYYHCINVEASAAQEYVLAIWCGASSTPGSWSITLNELQNTGSAVEGNPEVPSGVTPEPLTGLKVDDDYYSLPAGGLFACRLDPVTGHLMVSYPQGAEDPSDYLSINAEGKLIFNY